MIESSIQKVNYFFFQNDEERFKGFRLKPKPTILDQLTDEVVTSLKNDSNNVDTNATTNVEEKVFQFLSEEAIINRTKDCKRYFQKYISAQAMINKNNNVRSLVKLLSI